MLIGLMHGNGKLDVDSYRTEFESVSIKFQFIVPFDFNVLIATLGLTFQVTNNNTVVNI